MWPQARFASVDTQPLRARVRDRMPALDGLRGLAVIVIVWHNVAGVGNGVGHTLAAKIYFAAAATGWVAVTLFFALSGFLITGILLDSRDDLHAWRTFIVRRFLRIFPLYYVSLTIAFLLLPRVGILPSWLVSDRNHQAWYWTYLVNWSEPFGLGGPGLGHFWSLAVEEQFYLLWPFLALNLASRRLASVSAVLVLIALFARVALLRGPWTPDVATSAIYRFTICRWDALALGAMVAIAARDERWSLELLRYVWPGTLVLLACTLSLAVWRHGFGSWDWPIDTVGETVVAGLCAGIVALAAYPDLGAPAAFQRALMHPTLRAVAKYSYAIYVIHFPLTHVVAQRLPQNVVRAGGMESVVMFTVAFVGVFAMSYAAAMISWRLLENPMLSLRRHLA